MQQIKKTFKQKYLWQFILFVILGLILSSCSDNHLHRSKTYRVKSLDGNTATFYRLDGKYSIDTTGLKIGAKIYLQRCKGNQLPNVIRIYSPIK